VLFTAVKQPALSNIFPNGVRAHLSDQVKCFALSNASQKDDSDIQRQVKSLHRAANKPRGIFTHCLNILGQKDTSIALLQLKAFPCSAK